LPEDIPNPDFNGPFYSNYIWKSFLKLDVDIGITVWYALIGDKSSLRELRGVKFFHD
tara:strand:- start:298 stop:468 length:171 start_codon:yes stop_codon:yes gene_type:complete